MCPPNVRVCIGVLRTVAVTYSLARSQTANFLTAVPLSLSTVYVSGPPFVSFCRPTTCLHCVTTISLPFLKISLMCIFF